MITGVPPIPKPENEFEKELTMLINKHGVDTMANTPDYILADYVANNINCYICSVRKTEYHKAIADSQNEPELTENQEKALQSAVGW